jgi:cell division protein FtsA
LGSGIVLTGGTALLDGVVPLAEQVFQSPVRIGMPLNLSGDGQVGGVLLANDASFAAAVGLVQYGARPRDHVPVRTEDARFVGKVRQRLKGWVEAFF